MTVRTDVKTSAPGVFGACVLLLSAGSLVLAPAAVAAAAAPTPAACRVVAPSVPTCGRWWGEALDPGDQSLISAVGAASAADGRRLDIVHTYHVWNDAFPTVEETQLAHEGHLLMIGWKPITSAGQPVSWASIAAGDQDQTIAAEGRRLRALGEPVLLSFSYEPERLVGITGTPSQFAAAFRHVHDVIVKAGATNVEWVWTVMGLNDSYWHRTYDELWPGRQYVDWISWDPYNWASCRKDAWLSFAAMVRPFYQWVTAQDFGNLPLMLSEYGTVEDPHDSGRKASWFAGEGNTLAQFPRLRALVYFNLPSPPASCDWQSTTSAASQEAFHRLADGPSFRPTARLDPATA
jgi:hypothetical protein